MDFRPPKFQPVNPRLTSLDLFQPRDHPLNKATFRYTPCYQSHKSEVYHSCRDEPRHARLSWQDMSPFVRVSPDGLRACVEKGFRMARANVSVEDGRWYYECTIEAGAGQVHLDDGWPAHVRIGWARRGAVLGAPVGYDDYSYGLRDLTGDKVHQAKVEPYGPACQQGDVIGCLIELGLLAQDQQDDTQKSIPVLYRGQSFFELEQRPSSLPDQIWPESRITFYLNGKSLGVAFSDLKGSRQVGDGYTPAVSMYGGGTVALNFGPDWSYPPPDFEGVRSIEEMYREDAEAEMQQVRLEEEKAIEVLKVQRERAREAEAALEVEERARVEAERAQRMEAARIELEATNGEAGHGEVHTSTSNGYPSSEDAPGSPEDTTLDDRTMANLETTPEIMPYSQQIATNGQNEPFRTESPPSHNLQADAAGDEVMLDAGPPPSLLPPPSQAEAPT